MGKTEENLWAAFAGESQANRKYLAFANKAEKDGYPQAAKLFRAAAHAETVHAHAHLRALKAIGDTRDNLRAAMEGELHEFEEMYPPMIETAKAEGNKAAEMSFTFAHKVEKTHAELYRQALENLDNLPETDYYVCQVCGHTEDGDSAPDKCVVCGANSRAFSKIS
ncbi:rubrerythrin family protein [Desulfurivibrio alkaliphilus]|uniref:Rubrerythrin n=1 Tax=Desulfurivibrio alkaliphilus (strain DSM 19089 / UNIQEM U267 / AHT2) TaxID=589865 RepID=D6Z0L1_DESAT|nr:rubrerythrin family protein [Desulfurivibrio alkaliphilus]ADH85240.1 Rubrerythrin [Desulfurivibrio alkaliphilus AHT 2]